MKSSKTSLNLNINKDDSNINDYIYCWQQFGDRPNKVTIHNSYLSQDFFDIIDSLIVEKNTFTEILPDADCDIVNLKILAKINDNIFVAYVLIDQLQPDSIVSDMIFYYKEESDKDQIDKIVEQLSKDCEIDYEETEINKLNTLTISGSTLELERIETKYDIELFELYYNNKTHKDVNKLIKKIKKSQTGLSIFYGERGTGKTSMIHYLANKLDRIVMFVPNSMLEHTINNPEFRKFIKKHGKVLLVLDDCEMSFNEYFVRSNFIVNNLLQLIDGFLSESIDLSVVAIFNVEEQEEIDHNLLNCNNLIDVVEFEYLSEEESNELADHLGDKPKYKNKTKLIDIIKKRKIVNNKKLGF